MEETNKYYTPSIEEFHMEFEYEYLDNDIWYKAKTTEISAKDFESQLYGLRVKCLSKKDIESLGFKHIGSLWFDLNGQWKLRKWKDNSLDIWYNHGTFNHIGEEEIEIRFRGDIKNKSELIKLMKQLGINE